MTTHPSLQHHLRSLVEHAITHHPRTLQTALGPSEIGCGCDPCLVNKLAGKTPPELNIPWLPTIGTAVHTWLETAIQEFGAEGEWLTERKVTVGHINGVAITGHSDLFHIPSGTSIDWKIVGASTLRKAKTVGPTDTYKRQGHLYGNGYKALGYQVRTVAIYYLPRNAISLRDGHWWSEPHHPALANWCLTRAAWWQNHITQHGYDHAITTAGPHTGTEFDCPTTY